MIDEPLDEYLWDRSGDGDAELCELERLLSVFRHRQPLQVPVDDTSVILDESDG